MAIIEVKMFVEVKDKKKRHHIDKKIIDSIVENKGRAVWFSSRVMDEEGLKALFEYAYGEDNCDSEETETSSASTPEQLLWQGVMKQDPLEFLPLSVRAYNCLAHAEIDTMRYLVTHTREELLEIPKLGKKTVDEIEKVLADVGISLEIG